MSRRIDVDYLARVEGETRISVRLEKETGVELRIFEPPRFFEGFLVGRSFDEVGDIVSRICGICPVSHMTTAILAVERAMGIRVSDQTALLRKVMSISQIVASHLIHLYMLALPDYYGRASIAAMLPEHAEILQRLLKIKEAVNGVTALIGGRALHPVTHLPGGFTAVPKPEAVRETVRRLKSVESDARHVVLDTARLPLPDFRSDSEYVALDAEGEYAINGGLVVSSRGVCVSPDEYRETFAEYQVAHASAKQSVVRGRGSFMVGALARLHIKYDKLQDETKALAQEAGLHLPIDNPFYNIAAQALEVVDGIRRCVLLLESFSFRDEERRAETAAGEGGALTEAPRGLLYHWYAVDAKGRVEAADIVTPTSHNFLNMENDLKKLVEENRDKEGDAVRLLCEELVRAYDPCFSCSVH